MTVSGPPRMMRRLFIFGSVLPVLLGACVTENKKQPVIAAPMEPAAQRAHLRQSGATETTLGAFCNAPPQVQTPEGSSTIKTTCGRLRGVASDASVFHKGNGVYTVLFNGKVTQADLCGGQPKKGVCAGLRPGDTLTTMHFTAR